MIDEIKKLRNESLIAFVDRVVTLSASALTLTVAFRNALSIDVTHQHETLPWAWMFLAIATVVGTLVRLLLFNFYCEWAAAVSKGHAFTSDGWLMPASVWLTTFAFVIGIGLLTSCVF